ncbi:hypothetical protein [Agromyces humatus]|uniref:Uncharacterized protein n=1 Tax=Agromyces humatus TaxID=279573 RepID=A0ABP4X3Z6_9MICO|nr:hypothetical protein [Agromyces humatus]
MARGDIEVPISSETKGFKQGVETGIIKPLEDAEKALEELGKSKGADQLERDLEAAQKATDNLADETKDAARIIEREYRDAYRKMKQSADDGFDKAKEGANDLKDEAGQAGRESAASFRGEWSDVGEFIQETVANGMSGFGPLGAAAGIAAAVGIGVITSEIQKQQEEADELKRRLTEAYIAAAEEGRNYLSVQQIIEESGAIYEDAERLAVATADAAKFAVDRQLVVQAMAGDEDAINAVIAAGNALVDEGTQKMRDKADAGKNVFDIETAEVATLEQIVGKYQDQLGLQQTVKSNAEEYLALVEAQNAKEAAGNSAARQAITDRGAALERYYAKAANPPQPTVKVNVNTTDLDALERRLNRGATMTVRVNADGTIGRFLE